MQNNISVYFMPSSLTELHLETVRSRDYLFVLHFMNSDIDVWLESDVG